MSSARVNWLLAIVVVAVGASIVGTFIGGIVVRSRVNAFIVTLGAGTTWRGSSSGSPRARRSSNGIPSAYISIGNGSVAGVPTSGDRARVLAARVARVPADRHRSPDARDRRELRGRAAVRRPRRPTARRGLRDHGSVRRARRGPDHGPGEFVITRTPRPRSCSRPTRRASWAPPSSPNLFEITGTLIGVIFLATIQNGLLITGVPTWIGQVVAGSLLVIAVVSSKIAAQDVA